MKFSVPFAAAQVLQWIRKPRELITVFINLVGTWNWNTLALESAQKIQALKIASAKGQAGGIT